MVPTNILERIFHVAHNGSVGAAFTIDISDRQYIVTAKHVVEGLQSNGALTVMYGGQWLAVDIGDVWFSPTGADIALICPRQQLSPAHPLIVGSAASFYLSQQIYFLGFPYGLRLDLGKASNNYPLPFVKTGIISSFTAADPGGQIIYCDGHNNPGFSGGPIVTVGSDRQVQVIGVISGFRHNDDPIMLNGVATGLTYRANTGLVIGYGLGEVVEQASSTANGAPIVERI